MPIAWMWLFPTPALPSSKNVLVLLDETTVGKFKYERSIDSAEFPVERVERFVVAKAGNFDTALD
jgi:hypothetical protein